MAAIDTSGFRRAAAIGGVLLAAVGLAACTSVGGLFDRSPKAEAVSPGAQETPTQTASTPGNLVGHLSRSSIPVLVNDQPITRYDIEQRARLMRIGGAKGGEKAATEELIDEVLKMYEAAKRGVRIPEARVGEAYASIAKNLKMTPAQLTKALAGEKIDDASLKRRLRAQMTWQQLVERRAQLTATIKTSEVTQALLAKGDPGSLTMTEYVLQQIVFVVPAGSPSKLYEQRRREAAAFRQRFAGCDQSLAQAKQLRGVVVKDIGRRDTSQLAGPAGETIKKTPAGKTAPPTRITQGIELIAVCSTREIRSTAVARAEIQDQLFLKQADDLGKEYLQELRKRAIIEYR